MAKIGIVYGSICGAPRRIIMPDHDNQLDNVSQWIGTGEALLVVDKTEHWAYPNGIADVDACTVLVERHRGKPSLSSRCVVVSKDGEVKAVIHADPEIDKHPDGDVKLDEDEHLKTFGKVAS
jgi:hypothetical protein